MAYRKPTDLDGFIQQMPKADMRIKAQLAEDLVTFLSDGTNSIVCMDMGLLVDNLMPWLTGSHFKIAQKSLEAFSELIKRLGPDFNAYTATVLPHVIDRLGDSKDTVREKGQLLLQNLMEHRVLTPQALLDKLASSCLKHKNAKVREEFLQTIVHTLNERGISQVSVRTYIQLIASHLLGDPAAAVRDSAVQTLVEIYKHVGERMRQDLKRMEEIPPAKLLVLEQKFTQVKNEGLLLKSAADSATIASSNSNNNNNGNSNGSGSVSSSTNGHDEKDNACMNILQARPSRLVKRTVSASARGAQKTEPVDAGALTMDVFEACFEQVPRLNVFASKDLDDVYKHIFVIISDKNADWEKRVEALKKLRSLFIAQAHTLPQFPAQLKELSICFLDILKEELRSQVIREACITVAYMSKVLRQKNDIFCVGILDQLILLIQNSAKVIASSSSIAVKYIVKYTHAPKIIKIITDNYQQSKSKDIRASLCEIICLLLEEWPTKYMERYATLLRDTLKKSMSDADNEARRHSRRAYWLYRVHFPELADHMFGTFDIATQRALERERDGGSTTTTNTPQLTNNARFLRMPGAIQKPTGGTRSVSAVDAAAAQRAKVRHQYALSARKKVRNTNTAATPTSSSHATGSLPRPRYGMGAITANSAISETAGRTRSRSGVSQSQPGSRSTSPSAKLREQYGGYRPITGTVPKKQAGSSSIPRSLVNSRETSPTRVPMKRSLYAAGSSGSTQRRTPERSARPLAAARLLQQSRDAEGVFCGDVVSPEDYSLGDYGRNTRFGRKLMSREESDDSEASSVCSERSFESSYTRGHNFSYSLSGSRQRLDWSSIRPICDDIDMIIQYCSSAHWSERKDGLNSLTHYLAAGKELTPSQLQSVLDMFRKMFMDTHTKVYSLFLDAVTELILVHANDLHDWLFILLTRLFNKLGTELLNSMNGKILKTLQVVHEYFPTDLQMRDILRILSDNAQTPSIKSKIAMLKFLNELATTYCQPSDLPEPDDIITGTGSNSLSVDRALHKIVQLNSDQKSTELRGQARLCLVALYNCNTPLMTKWLATLPKQIQDSAKNVIQTHLQFNSNSPSSSPLSSSSPKPLQSPSLAPFTSLQTTTHALNTVPRSRQTSVEQELYSQIDEIQHNIHKTSEEIRHYTSTAVARETTSNTRQYHSLSANGFNGYAHTAAGDHLDSNTNSNCNSKTQSAATTESNTPEGSSNNTIQQQRPTTITTTIVAAATASTTTLTSTTTTAGGSSNISSKYLMKYNTSDTGELVLENGLRESEIIRIACALNSQMSWEKLQTALNNLSVCIKGGNGDLPNKHFRAIMKMLLELLDSQQPDIVVLALSVLSKILRSLSMRSNWIGFLELILLRIISYYQLSKETAREIDTIIPRIAPVLPLHATIDIVNPVIATSTYPSNLCAVKLLSELVERHGVELTEAQLDNVFLNLARLADDDQSMVRKAAVFCIVKLYFVMGEEKVKPKFNMLSPSKIRLLNVYIDKQRTSSSTSTKNSSAGSSS